MTTRHARCIENVISAYKRATGGHYFDDETMQVFGSKIDRVCEVDKDYELPALVVMSNADKRGPAEYRAFGGRRYYFVVGITVEGELIDADNLGVPLLDETLSNMTRGFRTLDKARRHAYDWLARMVDNDNERHAYRLAQLTDQADAKARAARHAAEAAEAAVRAVDDYRARTATAPA